MFLKLIKSSRLNIIHSSSTDHVKQQTEAQPFYSGAEGISSLESIKILKIDGACSTDSWIYLFFLTLGTPTCFYQFVHYRWGQNDTSQGDRFSLHHISFHISKWKRRGKTMYLQFFSLQKYNNDNNSIFPDV